MTFDGVHISHAEFGSKFSEAKEISILHVRFSPPTREDGSGRVGSKSCIEMLWPSTLSSRLGSSSSPTAVMTDTFEADVSQALGPRMEG